EKDLTNAEGKTDDLALKGGNYVLKVSKEGYLPQYVVVTPETDLNTLEFKLQRAVDCIALTGTLLMDNRHFPISGATVQIVDVETKESITVYTDDRGQFEYCVKCNRTFTVYAKKDDVTSAPVVASSKDEPCSADSRIGVTLYMAGTPLYAGMTIRLPNIYFNYDDVALRPDAYADLNEVVGMLSDYPGMKLELASHTDSRGGNAYNQDLSQRRSQSVFKYLTGKGIPDNRLTPRGYGESQIRNRCKDDVACNEQEHQYNRRTEIKILELGEPTASAPGIAETESERPGNEVESEHPGAEVESERPGSEVAMEEAKAQENKGGQEFSTVKVANEATGSKSEKEVEVGAFTVIAGTFSNFTYAQRRQKLLEQLGYGEVSIVKQERNGLYAVWVKSFDGKKDAFELVRKLAQQQLHSYVLRR
ncbi:MAG: OmpA family protein, partial [Bacteroidota bacterium]